MRIEYNILWFEDIKSSFNSKKQIVKQIVEDFGFIFPEPRNEINGENIESLVYDEFDLIIADLNLTGTKGTDLINKLRNQEGVYTEVIFYSSDGEKAVRGALKEYEIDGVYCAGRENDDFEEKVKKVIWTTIKKVQDVNNMRGLIMAETSDIDQTMFNIIATVLDKNYLGLRANLAYIIFGNVDIKLKSKRDDFDKFQKNKNIARVIKDNVMFDSSEKIKAIQFIINGIDHELANSKKGDVFSSRYTEVKKNRDLLAHVIEEEENGRKKLKSGNRVLEFTDDFCIGIRKEIQHHSQYLNDLLVLIGE